VHSLRRACVVAAAVSALGVSVVPVASADPVRTVDYTAEAGSHPLTGTAHYTGADAEIVVWEYRDVLKVDVQSGLKDLRVELSAPAGQVLRPGPYTGARFRGQSDPALATPGIFLYSGGLACGDDYADFTIDRLDQAADGAVTALDVTFVQHCGAPDAPATRGEVHYTA
jgi:hypothetical protein